MSKKNVDAVVETEAEEIEAEEVETEEVDEVDGETEEVESEEETVAKKDLDKVTKALDSERNINKEKSAEIRKLKRELKAATEKTPEDVDSQKLVAEADRRADKFKDIAVRKEASLALSEAGAKVSTTRLLKLLDLTDVAIDDDGNIDGLDDVIAELKEESPEFFKSDDDEEKVKRPVIRRPGSVDAGKKTPVQPKPLTPAERMAKMAMGKK